EIARAQVAGLIGAEPDEITFTSGATESNNLAILGVARSNADRGRHVVTTRIEHKAVLDPFKRLEREGFAVSYLTPDRQGLVDTEALRAALRPDTIFVSVMHVNNEIGVIEDIGALGAVCRERGIAFHTDAAQAAGKIPIDVRTLHVDFLALTAHKIYGPKGIGALYVRRAARPLLKPVLFGGGQERGLRPGTLPTHQIVGFGVACELSGPRMAHESQRLSALRERLWQGLAGLEATHLNGAGAARVPGILNVSFEGVEGESLVTSLAEVAVSTGSACNSASEEPSYVLRSLGRDSQLAQSSLRFSLGRFTTEADVDAAIEAVRREVARLRTLSPASEASGVSSQVRNGGAAGHSGGEIAVLTGEAGGPTQETWVRFHLTIAGDIVKAARFKAYGCPHTLDVAQWLSDRLVGRRRDEGVPGNPASWAETLDVPIERLGRLLVVEDALLACFARWPGSPTGSPERLKAHSFSD
ncbi:MAG TPA: aminotransferase class V-fold PLP-dependent enzyme, partial [Steroidobacteraceae bacterium]